MALIRGCGTVNVVHWAGDFDMTTTTLRSQSEPALAGNDRLPLGKVRMYAIAFDMDIESLRKHYGDPYNNAYSEIKAVLVRHGFTRQQGSVYFGDDKINAVTCVMAAMDLSRSLSWFSKSVRDIRMLRIEELNDLMPAVRRGEE
jgi:virulence-associated protein VapD